MTFIDGLVIGLGIGAIAGFVLAIVFSMLAVGTERKRGGR